MTLLERVCKTLSDSKVRYAIVGGHAVALHGAVRGTVDIDFVISWNKKTLKAAAQALSSLSLVSRIPVSADEVFDYRDEYIKNRNLIAWNFYNPDNLAEQIDIIINYDLKGKKVHRIRIADTTVCILDIRMLIEMKRDSGRPQDLEDVSALERLL